MIANLDTEQFNAEEIEPLEWLNSEFIAKALSNYEKVSKLNVTNLKISPASAQGDHYASIMFRIKVEYTTTMGSISKSLLVMTMPEQEGHKKDTLSESQFFATEIGKYSKALL